MSHEEKSDFENAPIPTAGPPLPSPISWVPPQWKEATIVVQLRAPADIPSSRRLPSLETTPKESHLKDVVPISKKRTRKDLHTESRTTRDNVNIPILVCGNGHTQLFREVISPEDRNSTLDLVRKLWDQPAILTIKDDEYMSTHSWLRKEMLLKDGSNNGFAVRMRIPGGRWRGMTPMFASHTQEVKDLLIIAKRTLSEVPLEEEPDLHAVQISVFRTESFSFHSLVCSEMRKLGYECLVIPLNFNASTELQWPIQADGKAPAKRRNKGKNRGWKRQNNRSDRREATDEFGQNVHVGEALHFDAQFVDENRFGIERWVSPFKHPHSSAVMMKLFFRTQDTRDATLLGDYVDLTDDSGFDETERFGF